VSEEPAPSEEAAPSVEWTEAALDDMAALDRRPPAVFSAAWNDSPEAAPAI
jgi:hypothetical protein